MMKKLIKIFILVICCALSILPLNAAAADEGEKTPILVGVSSHAHCICGDSGCTSSSDDHGTQYWTSWGGSGAETVALPTESGYYYLVDDITLSTTCTLTEGMDIKLCLNGHVISISDHSKTIFNVETRAKLTITDCKKTAHYFRYSRYGVWTVADSASSGEKAAAVDIKNLPAPSEISQNGILVKVGGGCITGGGTSSAPDYGGAVYSSGTFTMYGGNIIGNKATMGGGVYNTYGTVTIAGGCIAGNAAEHTVGNGSGGGIYASNKLIVNGNARIVHNIGSGLAGGGVFVGARCSVTVGGAAVIKDNTWKNGSTYVVNNLNMYKSGKTITTSSLRSGASIGVTMADKPTSGKAVAVTDASSSDVHSYFTSDMAYYPVINDGEGSEQVVKLTVHTHNWSYILSGTLSEYDTLTADCGGPCNYTGKDTTLTIIEPSSLTYDGKTHDASFIGENIFLGEALPEITYEYKATADGTYAPVTDTKAAGCYKASFTIGTGDRANTAYVEYTVVNAEPVAYIDENGEAQTCEGYKFIDAEHMPTVLMSGWYVVSGEVNYPEGGLTVSGDVRLILKDGCKLSVSGDTGEPGIYVSGSGSSLTVYGQSGGTGSLKTAGGTGKAGIGGDSGSAITINGGNVEATGENDNPGISGGSITINNGKVSASGGEGGAGIGDVKSTVSINGGEVSATGGKNSSGITGSNITITGGTVIANSDSGTGIGDNNSTIVISDGNVTATGGTGSSGLVGSSITINGGTVAASGKKSGSGITGSEITINNGTVSGFGDEGGSGIGGGKITVNDGTVYAFGGEGGTGLGDDKCTVSINGGTIMAYGGLYAAGIGGNDSTVTIKGGKINAGGVVSTGAEDIGADANGKTGSVILTGGAYANEPDSDYIPANCKILDSGNRDYPYQIVEPHVHAWSYSLGTVNAENDTVIAECIGKVDTLAGGTVLKCDVTDTTLTIAAPKNVIYDGTTEYYADFGDASSFCGASLPQIVYEYKAHADEEYQTASNNSSMGYYRASFTVGDGANALTACVEYVIGYEPVNYIDADGNTQTCRVYNKINGSNMPTNLTKGWYVVTGTNIKYYNTISVNGDVHLILTDDCSLYIQASYGNPGVRVSGSGNALTIYGQTSSSGLLSAYAGYKAAGIGGGQNESGSNITINGGIIRAYAYEDGAGIGGGSAGDGSNITINNGDVVGWGGDFAAGIGGGKGHSAYDITINGGKVRAYGEKYGAGIGGGYMGSLSGLTITGGRIRAENSDNMGDKIGGGYGYYQACQNNTITGGTFVYKPDKYVAEGYDIIEVDNDGYNYQVVKAHVHDWSYELGTENAENDTITATCHGNIEKDIKGEDVLCKATDTTLTIIAPAFSGYDGESHNAGFGTATSFCGGALPEIVYEYKASVDGTYSAVTETNVPGYYRASFTVGSDDNIKTAYIEYTYAVTGIILDSNTDSSAAKDGVATGTAGGESVTDIVNAENHGYELKGYSDSADSNEIILAPDGTLIPEREGYTDNDGKWISDEESVTLFAVWELTGYKVNFEVNTPSGSSSAVTGEMQEQVFEVDETQNLTSCGYKLTGYTFTGWSTNPDGSGTVFNDGAAVKNLATAGETFKLYAVWSGISYTVRFEANAPTDASTAVSGQMTEQIFAYDKAQKLIACSFSLDGYEFSGWTTAKDGSGTVYTDGATVINLSATDKDTVTLYAKWSVPGQDPGVIIEYNVVSGSNGTVTKGSGKDYTLTVKRNVDDDTCFDHFTSVEVDGKQLNAGTDYTAKRGSTVITLNNEFVDKLSKGKHAVTVNFDDGSTTMVLTVKAAQNKDDVPATGDSNHPAVWLALSLSSIMSACAVLPARRKTKYKN